MAHSQANPSQSTVTLAPGDHYLRGESFDRWRYRGVDFTVSSDGSTMLVDDHSMGPVRVTASEGMRRWAQYLEWGYRPCDHLGALLD
jgi:hypothetical protein